MEPPRHDPLRAQESMSMWLNLTLLANRNSKVSTKLTYSLTLFYKSALNIFSDRFEFWAINYLHLKVKNFALIWFYWNIFLNSRICWFILFKMYLKFLSRYEKSARDKSIRAAPHWGPCLPAGIQHLGTSMGVKWDLPAQEPCLGPSFFLSTPFPLSQGENDCWW